MEHISGSSFDEFAKWYLDREVRKGCEVSTPLTPEERFARMQEKHEGKMRPWFPDCTWSIVNMTSLDEFLNLMILDVDWTKRENLVVRGEPRTLRITSERALKLNYFVEETQDREKHQNYYKDISEGNFAFRGADRFVVRSLQDNEEKERRRLGLHHVSYYLHDGFGRALPYAALILQGHLEFAPVESFLAEENT